MEREGRHFALGQERLQPQKAQLSLFLFLRLHPGSF
jgi:hypothetical protein